jgi:hypothetical protein
VARFDIQQHLTIEAVARRDCNVRVDVAHTDGEQNWISFDFPDADDAVAYAATMEAWMHTDTRVTYVRGPRDGALIDEQERFRQAFDGGAGPDPAPPPDPAGG